MFTKKIGVSKNQDHMGFCVLFLTYVVLFFQTSQKDFWSCATNHPHVLPRKHMCIPAGRGSLLLTWQGCLWFCRSNCRLQCMWRWLFLSKSIPFGGSWSPKSSTAKIPGFSNYNVLFEIFVRWSSSVWTELPIVQWSLHSNLTLFGSREINT